MTQRDSTGSKEGNIRILGGMKRGGGGGYVGLLGVFQFNGEG